MKNKLTFREAKSKIDNYFESKKRIMRDKKGEFVLDNNGDFEYEERPCTVTGLALALGFSSRDELFLVEDEKIKVLIDTALLMIEEKAEEKLFDKESFNGTKLFLATNFPRWKENMTLDESDEDLGVFSTWAK